MVDDINKKISVEVAVTKDGQEQIDQYKAAFDSRRATINGLGKPLADLSSNISSLNKDLSQLASATEKSAAKMIASAKNASDQQAKINTDANQKLKTSLSEAGKMKEQALAKELVNKYDYYGESARAENDAYDEQKKKLDDLFKAKGLSQELYNQEAEQLLKQHYDRLKDIVDQYVKDNDAQQKQIQASGTTQIDKHDFNNYDVKKVDLMASIQEKLTEETKKGEDTRSKTIFDSAKNTLSKVYGLFVKTEADKGTATTDSTAKTNKTVADGATKLQQEIGTKTLQITQDVADSAYKIISESITLQTNAKVNELEAEKKKELSNTSLTADAKTKINNDYATKEKNVKLKGFKEQQKVDMGQAIINGAVAVTKVTAQSGVLAPVMCSRSYSYDCSPGS